MFFHLYNLIHYMEMVRKQRPYRHEKVLNHKILNIRVDSKINTFLVQVLLVLSLPRLLPATHTPRPWNPAVRGLPKDGECLNFYVFDVVFMAKVELFPCVLVILVCSYVLRYKYV